MVDIEALWEAGPPKGMGLNEWLCGMVKLEWKGADEPPHTITGGRPEFVACVCGVEFVFADGSNKARCPGCGARYAYSER